jgi:Holliday junction resolvasome RuvABC endonuclease subunit
MGIVNTMSKQKAATVMGIDSSTHSLAFAVIRSGKLIKYGKINFTGSTSYERLADSRKKILALQSQFDVDYIAIEKAIMVRSVDTAIKMGMALGVIISSLMDEGVMVVEVAPITWQSYIGNKNYTRAQKKQIKDNNPGKSESWIKNKIREERKQFTIDFFNKKYATAIDDNDVSDAIGIAYYASKELTR